MKQEKQNKSKEKDTKGVMRPPIVVVLGHVDHGKTTLLDNIRKTNIVEKESGGITQHIGAYQVEHNNKLITFIDTPGHEAFSQMRSRGAKVADIAILVIAAEEGVKPQTKEVISYIKKEKMSVIVALNKMDKPQANPEKVIGELEKEGVLTEERGGQVPAVKISAKESTGIDELLEMILLVAEMEEIKADIEKPVEGVVIESYLDSKKGATATFLVLEGTLKVGQWIICGRTYGKIRILEDFRGKDIKEIFPGTPAIVIGLNEVPIVGERFSVVESEDMAREKSREPVESAERTQAGPPQSESLGEEAKKLNLILKADVKGSLEAIEDNLAKMDLEGVGLNILKTEVGEVSESDVKTAYPANALIIGFRVKIPTDILNLAKRSGTKIKTYEVIYELFEEIRKQAAKLLEPEITREELGKLKVLAIFRREKSRMIVGGKVIEGRVVNKVSLDVIRPGEEDKKIASGKIVQLQHNKKDVGEVEKGREAGILYEGEPVIEEGDILEIYKEEKKKREL
jgi:translation initiation factor IF-2